MGFLDKFLDKLKLQKPGEVPLELLNEPELPEEQNVIISAQNTQEQSMQKPEAVTQAVSRDEYIKKYRSVFMHLFPENFDSVENHMQLPLMINSLVNISPVLEYAKNEIYSKLLKDPEKFSEGSRAAVSKVAVEIEKSLFGTEPEQMRSLCGFAHTESLGKAWIVLDFYCRMLRQEYTRNISRLHSVVTDELIARGYMADSIRTVLEYEKLLLKCSELSKTDSDKDSLMVLKRELLGKLFDLESVFVLYCGSSNKSFPYVGNDGKVEILTDRKRASDLMAYIEKKQNLEISVVEYKNEQFEKLFSDILHSGLFEIRLERGKAPVEMDIREYYTNDEENILEVSNRYIRGMFIRKVQYEYRLDAFPSSEVDSDEYKNVSALMLKTENRLYRAFAGGVFYALCEGKTKKDEITLYTPRAMERAKEIMAVMETADEKVLVASGDSGYDVMDTEPVLKSIKKRSAESGFVCAFSDVENAEKIRARFKANGADCQIVAVTPIELCSAGSVCSGIVMDIGSYGFEIPSDVFTKIGEYVKSGGVIVNGKE
ncbi:MAG: hypothetical protein IKI97_02215 [Clostridia bacterium]|nr:hypothetical protein [Clostridia bacterium]